MARKAANPGVGRGHGTRERKERICGDCGSTFLAARSDAVRCPACWNAVRRSLDNRTVSPGVGTGHGIRPKKQLICVDCGNPFEAVRSDAQRCIPCGNTRQYRYEQRAKGTCAGCGAPVTRRSELCLSCRAKTRKGEKNPSWKGGRTEHDSGYWQIRIDGKYVMEHRRVWEQANGPIPEGFEVHHLNGDPSDNRIENLMAMSKKDHHTQHKVYEVHIAALEARIRELEGHP